MLRQPNIMSFDDARRSTRVRREQDVERDAAAASHPASRRGKSGSRSTGRSSAPRPSEPRVSRANSRSDQRHENRSRRIGSARAPKDARSVRERKRHQCAKERASKMFDRQVAAESSRAATVQEEDAPRAALYEGKMGASHRRSARMQRASSAGSASAKVNPAGWFSNLNVTARSLKLGTAMLCVVLAFVFLYAPARQFYQAERENDRLAAEYAIVAQRNEVLDAQNDTLASDAGMEDAVRQKYGYVIQGDETAVVSGLSDDVIGTARAADNGDIEANVLSSTVKAPEEWYTPFLDAFFGVG